MLSKRFFQERPSKDTYVVFVEDCRSEMANAMVAVEVDAADLRSWTLRQLYDHVSPGTGQLRLTLHLAIAEAPAMDPGWVMTGWDEEDLVILPKAPRKKTAAAAADTAATEGAGAAGVAPAKPRWTMDQTTSLPQSDLLLRLKDLNAAGEIEDDCYDAPLTPNSDGFNTDDEASDEDVFFDDLTRPAPELSDDEDDWMDDDVEPLLPLSPPRIRVTSESQVLARLPQLILHDLLTLALLRRATSSSTRKTVP